MNDKIILVERHIISKKHQFFKECDHLTFLSKNLYNSTLFRQRESFFDPNKEFLNYFKINKIFVVENNPDYRALPAKVSQQIQMIVDRSFKSFFALKKMIFNGTYSKKAKLPNYLDKVKGRMVVPYEKGALSLKEDGFVKLSKTKIKIKTLQSKKSIIGARIVPKGNHFVIEILFEKEIKPKIKSCEQRVAFIDPGMNNLMTVTSNVFNPIIYNGKVVKSINQLANKNFAKIASKQENKDSTKVKSIYSKRNNRIDYLFHKITSHLVNHLVSNNVSLLIFGHNKGQKQDVNLGKKTNQNFVSIPFYKLISMLKYKCELNGIEFLENEESYTSKTSFLDLEPIQKLDNYVGKRVKRGLFKTKTGKLINADVNGSLNIGRKALSKLNLYNDNLHKQLVDFMVNPKKITIK